MVIISIIMLNLVLNPVTYSDDTLSGSICGTVSDIRGNPLIGATVMIVGTSMGAMTNANGAYIISEIPCGTYSLQANMVGLTASLVEGISITSGESTSAEFILNYWNRPPEDIPIIIEI